MRTRDRLGVYSGYQLAGRNFDLGGVPELGSYGKLVCANDLYSSFMCQRRLCQLGHLYIHSDNDLLCPSTYPIEAISPTMVTLGDLKTFFVCLTLLFSWVHTWSIIKCNRFNRDIKGNFKIKILWWAPSGTFILGQKGLFWRFLGPNSAPQCSRDPQLWQHSFIVITNDLLKKE